MQPGKRFSIGGISLGMKLSEISESCAANPDFRLVGGAKSYELIDDNLGGSLIFWVDSEEKVCYVRVISRVALYSPQGLEIRTRDPIEKLKSLALPLQDDGPVRISRISGGYLEIQGFDMVMLYRLARDRSELGT